IGLKESEIKIYLYLLEHGVSTPPNVSRGTNIARPNCYPILQDLKDKGLVQEQWQKKRKVYFAVDPLAIVQHLERKKESMQSILPDLRALYVGQKNKPTIRFYDGLEQVKQIFDQMLSAKKILGIASTKQLFALDPVFFNHYRQELKQRSIIFYDILTHASDTEGEIVKASLKGLYDKKFLPKEYEDVPTDILIWDDHVALITTEHPVFGTVLTNPPLARTFQIIFEVLWKRLE
ncbi:helix-turn-helix transcriptional regulator, partial [Candidatus Uhrbacteria bacterium]|nr:helix-turn-helix transcriptional regulator [Candidatus Uhrbacteria bacterium]